MSVSLSHQFLEFVRSKPRDEAFNPQDVYGCAGFQFLKGAGYPVLCCGFRYWVGTNGGDHKFPATIADAIRWASLRHVETGQVTFGALADRLEHALSEKVGL